MQLKSSAFNHNEDIPSKFTCDSENINPPFSIVDAPGMSESFVLIIDDPDATGGATFDHWIVWNIVPETTEIEEGSAPKGALQGKNDFGEDKYGGPCPPAVGSKHHYNFKLYALDKILNIPEGVRKKEIEKLMEGHILDQALLIGLYGR